jgi:hypothetical protein
MVACEKLPLEGKNVYMLEKAKAERFVDVEEGTNDGMGELFLD